MKTRMSIAEYKDLRTSKALGKKKYRNVRTEYGGRWYDSKLEARCARILDILVENKMIVGWSPQPSFVLSSKTRKRIRPDFLVVEMGDISQPKTTINLFDAKGVITSQWLKMRQLFYDHTGLWIREIKHPSELEQYFWRKNL